ncbi:MAG: DUF2384 domain-containing protein [Gammaproteobacteria bacterium]|nr:MAG: DUF2384 domain-containing protein [Gammaproteobacteria bacterium]RTZ62137.1 MAG: DUF2384 domain-containing protein [Gammaproteobacteria bacterium]
MAQDYTHEQRVMISNMIMSLLRRWGIPQDRQVEVLGLPADTRARGLNKYHNDTPLPDDPEVMARVKYLAHIADALRTSYPHNPEAGFHWMTRPHRRFDGCTPAQVIAERGRTGIIEVLADLDCAYAWEISSPCETKAARA